MSNYDLFLFDLDDTLLDFRASEQLALTSLFEAHKVNTNVDELMKLYKKENQILWQQFERGEVSKDQLKVQRFQKVFDAHKIDLDPAMMNDAYQDLLVEKVVLIDHAVEVLDYLSKKGEVGIITNGVHLVATRRIQNSALKDHISFICVSETCGFAKPDTRFFDQMSKMAKKFAKADSVVIGDRLETDIQGASNYEIDACWYNPKKLERSHLTPKFEIHHLSEIKKLF